MTSMPDENLLKYIKDGLAMGRTEDIIRPLLGAKGYAQKDVDDAFNFLKTGQTIAPSQSTVQPQQFVTPQNFSPVSTSNTNIISSPIKKASLNPFSHRGRMGRLRFFLSSLALYILTLIISIALLFFSFSAIFAGVFGFLGHVNTTPSIFEYLAVMLIPVLPSFILRFSKILSTSGVVFLFLLKGLAL